MGKNNIRTRYQHIMRDLKDFWISILSVNKIPFFKYISENPAPDQLFSKWSSMRIDVEVEVYKSGSPSPRHKMSTSSSM